MLGLIFCISEAGWLTADVARRDRLAGSVDRGQDGLGCHFAGLEDDGSVLVTPLGFVTWGCWPLMARITSTADFVTWDAFE
jgi:hypothetical protein